MGLVQKIGKWFFDKERLIDATSLTLVTNPVFAAFETFAAGMEDETSINARLLAAGLTYAGFGDAFMRGRKLSRKLCHIADDAREKVQHTHDALFAGAWNLVLGPPFYLISGADTFAKVAVGTLSVAGVAASAGGPLCYVADIGADMAGVRESPRTPGIIKRRSPRVKKMLYAGAMAGLLAVNVGIYQLTPEQTPQEQIQTLERNVTDAYSSSQKALEGFEK